MKEVCIAYKKPSWWWGRDWCGRTPVVRTTDEYKVPLCEEHARKYYEIMAETSKQLEEIRSAYLGLKKW